MNTGINRFSSYYFFCCKTGMPALKSLGGFNLPLMSQKFRLQGLEYTVFFNTHFLWFCVQKCLLITIVVGVILYADSDIQLAFPWKHDGG